MKEGVAMEGAWGPLEQEGLLGEGWAPQMVVIMVLYGFTIAAHIK